VYFTRMSTAGAARRKTISSPGRRIWRPTAPRAPRPRPTSSGCSCTQAHIGSCGVCACRCPGARCGASRSSIRCACGSSMSLLASSRGRRWSGFTCRRRAPPRIFCVSCSGVSRASSPERRGAAPRMSSPSHQPANILHPAFWLVAGEDAVRPRARKNRNNHAGALACTAFPLKRCIMGVSSGTGVAAPSNVFSNPGIDFNQGAIGIGGGQVNPVRDTGAASITSMPDTSGYPSGVPGGLGSDFFNGGGDVGTQLPSATNGSAPTSLGIIGGGDVSSGSPLGIFGTLGGNTGGLGGQIGNALGGGAGGGGGGPGGTLGGPLGGSGA